MKALTWQEIGKPCFGCAGRFVRRWRHKPNFSNGIRDVTGELLVRVRKSRVTNQWLRFQAVCWLVVAWIYLIELLSAPSLWWPRCPGLWKVCRGQSLQTRWPWWPPASSFEAAAALQASSSPWLWPTLFSSWFLRISCLLQFMPFDWKTRLACAAKLRYNGRWQRKKPQLQQLPISSISSAIIPIHPQLCPLLQKLP